MSFHGSNYCGAKKLTYIPLNTILNSLSSGGYCKKNIFEMYCRFTSIYSVLLQVTKPVLILPTYFHPYTSLVSWILATIFCLMESSSECTSIDLSCIKNINLFWKESLQMKNYLLEIKLFSSFIFPLTQKSYHVLMMLVSF